MKVENQMTEEIVAIESQLVEKFQVEELEKRFEFGWIQDLSDKFGIGIK